MENSRHCEINFNCFISKSNQVEISLEIMRCQSYFLKIALGTRVKIIPRYNISDTANTVSCERHQPKCFETLNHYGKGGPKHPPSFFKCVKRSMISTKAFSNFRKSLPDEMGYFLQQYSVNDLKNMCTDIWKKCLRNKNCTLDCNREYIQIQSKKSCKKHEYSKICTENTKQYVF